LFVGKDDDDDDVVDNEKSSNALLVAAPACSSNLTQSCVWYEWHRKEDLLFNFQNALFMREEIFFKFTRGEKERQQLLIFFCVSPFKTT
jgi:hypothetical protein